MGGDISLDEMKKLLNPYRLTKQEAFDLGVCIRCEKIATCYSAAGFKEYSLSGLCEACFDEICVPIPIEVFPEPEPFVGKGASDEDDDAAYDFETIASEWAFKQAKLQGLDIVLPNANELQIDIDNEDDHELFHRNLEKFELHVGYTTIVRDEPSKSGDPEKRHITLRMEDDIDPKDRILYQLFLGSDRKRELLSYIRYINDDENPTLFYEKKPEALPAPPEQKLLTSGE